VRTAIIQPETKSNSNRNCKYCNHAVVTIRLNRVPFLTYQCREIHTRQRCFAVFCYFLLSLSLYQRHGLNRHVNWKISSWI